MPLTDPDLLSGVVDAPPELTMEMAGLVRFKTSTLTALGLQRNGVWECFVIEGGRARLAAVKTGRSNGVRTEILSGLAEGARVIVYPGDKVQDGTRVSPLQIEAR